MAQPVLKVRAWGSSAAYTDLVPYLAEGGLKWSRNDIDASNSGRDTQDGLMHRARVAIKARLDGTCRPLTQSELSTVLTALQPEWLQVQYHDPTTNATVTKKMYSNNIPASFLIMRGTTQYWTGVTFPLIEQ